jgi:phage terminase small subunit
MKQTKQHNSLSVRERLFAQLYLVHKGNGTKAAREAGYSGDLARRATELLKKASIVAIIERERARLVAKAELKAEQVIEELMCIAFSRINRLYRPNGELIPISELDPHDAAAVRYVDFRNGKWVQLRMWDKLQALDLLGQYLKLWDGKGNLAGDRLKEVIEAMRQGPSSETIQ